MTDHRRLQDNIVSKLSWYVTNIKLNTALDYFDENKDAEFFFCLPLGLLFDADVRNINADHRNCPGIDLGDREKRICFQITTTNTKTKVQHTLNEFLKHHLDNDFDRLVVLIVNTDPLPNLTNLTFARPFDFDDKRDVWNMQRLIRYFDALPVESYSKLQALSDYLDQQLPGAAPMMKRLRLPPSSALGKDSFVGRDSEKAQIQARIDRGEKLIVLSGLGGMGKTELAVRFGQDYQGGAVYFIQFKDSFTHTVSKMAQGIRPELSKDALSRSDKELCNDVLRILESCGERDILIIDNVDADSGTLKKLMDDETYEKLSKMDIRLLLTTRFSHDRSIIPIPRLDKDELIQIFKNHNAPVDQPQMEALIRAVNGHTLTIDLIARTLADEWTPVTAEEMLEALANSTLAKADFAEVDADYHESKEQLHIYQRLRTVFKVADIPEQEQNILRCATLLPETGMDIKLFRAALPKEQQKALPPLGKRGWLNAENGLVTIHPVIRLVLREELTPSDETCGDFLNALWRQLRRDEYDRIKFAQMAELFALAADTLEDAEAKWLNHSGYLRNELMQSQMAKELYEKHLPDLEKRLPDHLSLATAYNNVGGAYGCLGNYKKALEHNLKALAIRKKTLPEEDPDLALSFNNVGGIYDALGNHRMALKYKMKALEILEKVLPADHPNLARSFNNVGSTYGALGDQRKAQEYKLKALAILEKVLPADHPNLATAYDNMGGTYAALGDHRMAQEYNLKALAIREKVLPEDHPDLATSYNNVGYSYGALGDHKNALEYKRKALAIREKVLPPDHPHLAASYNNVGNTYGDLGNYRKAREYNQKALAIREKVLPPDHPDLATSYNNVGSTYGDLGNHRMALEYKLKALAIRQKVLPADHPDLATSYNNVGVSYAALGNHRMALKYKLKALAIREKVLPEDHPDFAASYNNVGSTYSDLKNHRMALKCKLKALEIRQKVLPKDHPNLAHSYNNVGSTYGDLGNHQMALEYKLKALEIRQKVLPKNHPDLATSYNNVGVTYNDLGDHRMALEYQQKALAIREKELPLDHPDLAFSYNSVGYTYGEMGDYPRALKCLEKALDILQRVLPAGHPDIDMTKKNIARIRKKKTK